LLKQSDSLEIPGFGCLSKLSQHANFSVDKALLNAGKQILVFEKNEASKDFQLAEQLAKQENISIQEAQNFLTETVNEWKILIDKGESILLDNIGSIQAEHDIWKLSPIAESAVDEESYGFSPIKLPTVKTTDEHLISDAISETNEVANEETNESDNHLSKIVSWKERLLAKIKTWNWRNISIASVVFLIAYTFLFVISRPSIFSKQKTISNTTTELKLKDTLVNNTASLDSLNNAAADTLIPIAQIVKNNTAFKKQSQSIPAADPMEDAEVDEDIADTASFTNFDSLEARSLENTWSPKKYQLVAGVYKSKVQAQNMELNLNYTGFEAKLIKIKKGYRVIIGDYDTMKEAKENLSLANQINPIFYIHIQ
ncbi:MAG: SPOR domain-containing protein, partial [Sphingobacteriaceae bacterium]